MLFKKTIKKVSIIIGIAIIVLWFGGNLGFYIYHKSIFDDETEKALNKTPEKLTLSEAKVDAENISIMGFNLKFPFYKEDIISVIPLFWEEELDTIVIFLRNRKKDQNFIVEFKTAPYIPEAPLFKKIKSWIVYGAGTSEIYYSRLTDYSWWNIRHNIRLSTLLHFKLAALPKYTNYQIFDLKTPYLNGFLKEGKSEYREGKFSQMVDFQFILKNKQHFIRFLSNDDETVNKARDIMTTVRPIDNIEESYKEMEVLYRSKERSRYPKELLLLSMISLKGATVDNLEELLKILEAKNYKQSHLIEEQIEYLKNKN